MDDTKEKHFTVTDISRRESTGRDLRVQPNEFRVLRSSQQRQTGGRYKKTEAGNCREQLVHFIRGLESIMIGRNKRTRGVEGRQTGEAERCVIGRVS